MAEHKEKVFGCLFVGGIVFAVLRFIVWPVVSFLWNCLFHPSGPYQSTLTVICLIAGILYLGLAVCSGDFGNIILGVGDIICLFFCGLVLAHLNHEGFHGTAFISAIILSVGSSIVSLVVFDGLTMGRGDIKALMPSNILFCALVVITNFIFTLA